MIPSSKICSKCTLEKESNLFWKEAAAPDGLSRWCIQCRREYGKTEDRKKAEKQRREDPKVKAYRDSYRADPSNKDKKNEGAKERRKQDPMERLACNMRSRTSVALRQRRFNKNSKLKQYLGCSLAELKQHLESKFLAGMTWENYGFGSDKWNIDHIVPLYSASNEIEIIALLHYQNLQPLWQPDNLIKGTN